MIKRKKNKYSLKGRWKKHGIKGNFKRLKGKEGEKKEKENKKGG